MKKLVLFKSPTCGPCKMFTPQVQQASETLNIDVEYIDVSTDEGLKKAEENNVNSSGILILFEDNKELKRWERPCAASQLVKEINEL